jgi:ketosteroid isomerase-like protein
MSQKNVERLHAFLEPWGREPWTPETWGRAEVIDMSFLHPEVVYQDENLPDHIGEAYRGHDGVRRAAQRWVEPNEWLLVELKQIIGEGDRLVSIHRLRSKASHSGIEFDTPLAYLWTFRNGKIVHFRSFRDPDEALEAAGLLE